MKDFTLRAYRNYLVAIKDSGLRFCTFEEYLLDKPSQGICLIRHDVDRKPKNALLMAELEKELGVQATYYFRDKRCSWNREIVKSIHSMGHEVGYHYECLSDANGDISSAHRIFENALGRFNNTVPIKTISMHGRPLSPHDSRDMWKVEGREKLLAKLGILGEVYLDVDYRDVAYINDTGRNWLSNKSNLRDKVESSISADFESGEEMLADLKSGKFNKVVFQVHPERWSDNPVEWFGQAAKDSLANSIKFWLRLLR